jgi:hydrogenase maturation protease
MGTRGPGADLGPSAPIVIGLGNAFRGDDAVGLLVARRLRDRVTGLARVLDRPVLGPDLLELWEGRVLAVVVDAMQTGRPPGTQHRIEVGAHPLPASLAATSSHGFSLAQAIALGQTLGRMPRRLVLFGIEATSFDPGTPPSAPVEAAVPQIARRIEEELLGVTGARFPVSPEVQPDA